MTWLKLLSIFAITIIFQIPYLFAPLGTFDEGIPLVAALRVLQGDKFYTDFWYEYSPGIPMILAASFRFTGDLILSLRIFEILNRAFLICLLYCCYFYPQLKQKINPLILSFGLLFLSEFDLYGSNALYGITCSLFLLTLFWLKPSWHFSQGIVFGALLLIRHDFAAYSLISFIIFSIITSQNYFLYFNKRHIYGFVLSLFPLILVVLPSRLLITKVYEQLIIFPISIYPKVRGIEFPSLAQLLNPDSISSFTTTLLFFVFPLFIMLIGSILLYLHKNAQNQKILLISLGSCLLSGVLLKYAHIRTDSYHLFPSKFLFFYACILIISWKFDVFLTQNWCYRYSCFLSLLLTCIFIIKVWIPFLPMIHTIEENSYKTVLLFNQRERLLASNYVANITQKNDKIFLVSENNDVTITNDVAFYVLTGRLPGSHYQELHPGVTSESLVQTEIIQQTTQNSVNIFIRQLNTISDTSSTESNILDNYIDQNFTLVFKSGNYQVLQRKIKL